MEQALSLAKLAVGCTSPNPAVGAIIVKDGAVVGQGYTQPPGFPHAEIIALNEAGGSADGGTLYVTLEPCCHYGKTPPCTRSIITAGINEVHFATIDPNPLVAGKGKTELENGGIRVHVGEYEAEAKQLNEAYFKFITQRIPFVSVKFAISLDGKIATKTGDSKWISSDESRKYVHNLRHSTDAIMVGINTVLADDPQLTCRCCGGRGGVAKKQPLRIIIDSQGRTPLAARALSQSGKTIIAMSKSATTDQVTAFTQAGAEILELPAKDGLVDLEKLLIILGERQIVSILVEGGGELLGSLFDNGLVDKVIAFIAPIVIGGREAKTAVGGDGVDKLATALKLKNVTHDRCGEDVVVIGYTKD